MKTKHRRGPQRMTSSAGLFLTGCVLILTACLSQRSSHLEGTASARSAPSIGTTPIGTPASGYNTIAHHPTYGIAYANRQRGGGGALPADADWHGVGRPVVAKRADVDDQWRSWIGTERRVVYSGGGSGIPDLNYTLANAWGRPQPADPQWAHEFDTLESRYLVQGVNGRFVAVSALPDPAGVTRDGEPRGAVTMIPIMVPGQAEATLRPVLNGTVWTPHVEHAAGVDLSQVVYLTKVTGFDFDAFKSHPAVVPFKNGYAVNLYGARVWDGFVCSYQPTENYKSSGGRNLPGRLIRGSNGVFSELFLVPGSADLYRLPQVP
ncbi:MAG: hypothetical protein JSU86_10315 [Phycisphaerales bacterium]|nr:MAG: hypothetical protein JSU86_10315 [Phycisphaerales bacterium]